MVQKQQKIYMVVKDGLHILQPIHGDIQLYQVVFFGDYSRLHLLGLPLIYGHNMITHKIKDFLKNTAYPLLKSNAEFLLDYMVIDPRNNYLVTGPSISPENSFRHQGQNFAHL